MPYKTRHFLRISILTCLAGVISPHPTRAGALPSLKDKDFKRISFVGRCEQNQWATTKDEKLEIMMSAEPGESCEARLHFEVPQDIKILGGLQFFVRSSRPKQRMAIELVGTTEGDPEDSLARTRPFIVSDEWAPNAMRFQTMRKAWRPQTISEIRFIAMSDTGRSAPSLYIQDVRFTAVKSVSDSSNGSEIASPAAADIPIDRQLVCVAANDLPSLQTHPPLTRGGPLLSSFWMLAKDAGASFKAFLQSHGILVIFTALWAMAATWYYKRKKSYSSSRVSPLYEINTRTWKSSRDADGVHHLGGFKSITLSDLKEIKSSGFSGIWLMGTWEIGPKVRAISKKYGQDFLGSPFAIRDYRPSEELGSEQEFDELIARAHMAGLSIMVDFVPNHMGMDSDWLNDHPEYFIHRQLSPNDVGLPDHELEKRYPGYFVHRTPSYPVGRKRVPQTILVAYGKDPYFYPWIDTAQLDYAEPGLRRRMTDILCGLARKVDGVRCDMAMLVLREQVKIHRHPDMTWENFNRLMPEEFWPEAIHAAKRINPTFMFLAETYWAMEGYLQQLGFDYTYNKPLYEAICSAFHAANAEGLLNFMRLLGNDFLTRGVHFIENHDEERAMNALGEERQRAAAAVIATLPGIALVHQGQMEGKRERLPVQRAVPVHQEPVLQDLRQFYEGLLKATARPLFRNGRLNVLYSNNPSFITYARMNETEKAIVIINTSPQIQKGSITVVPGIPIKTGITYEMHDLFYSIKTEDVKKQSSVMPIYHFTSAQLITQGLYVELAPYDAHIFIVEPHAALKWAERIKHTARAFNEGMPLPRLARRVLGAAMMRSSDLK